MPVSLLGAAEIRALAAELDVTPTKKLGQNFVVDANTVRKIVQVARVAPGDRVVEVGPGLGSLTLAILETGASVTAVEIDHRLAERLPATAAAHGVTDGALTVIDADALRITELPGDPTVLVANLPYNVSVPVLLHFLETFPALQRGVVMVQAEVGERLAAPPGIEDLRRAERQGRLVRAVATGRAPSRVRCSGRSPTSTACSSPSSATPSREAARTSGGARSPSSTPRSSSAARCCGRRCPPCSGGSAAAASAVLERADVAPTARGEELSIEDFVRIARTALPAVTPGYAVPRPFSRHSRNMPVTFSGLGHAGAGRPAEARGKSACVMPSTRPRSACCSI